MKTLICGQILGTLDVLRVHIILCNIDFGSKHCAPIEQMVGYDPDTDEPCQMDVKNVQMQI
jgi:hypothetical protein